MFRNYLAAALRNLARNRLYAAINIVGLAVAMAAALLALLYLRHELSYDAFLPGQELLVAAETPLGARLGKPDDIAKVVGFFASDASSWLTGERISASGGSH